MILSKTA